MRVLLCALEAPLPPTNGLKVHVEGALDALRRSHDVRLLAYGPPDAEPEVGDGRLVPRGWDGGGAARKAASRLAALASGEPWATRPAADGLRAALREEVERFRPDVLHVVSGRLAGLATEVPPSMPSVLSAIDAWHVNAEAAASTSSGVRRWALSLEARNVRTFERRSFGRFDRIAVVTERDRDALRDVAPSLPVVVVPHGVDSRRFTPDARAGAVEVATIVLHGVMWYPPNVDAACFLATEILPLVREVVPTATLAIVGRDPVDRVRALGGLPGVTVTGAVADVRPWLAGASVYACPARVGGGVKNKVLEAMACGAPCVVSPLALEGIAAEHGRHVLIADGAEETAHAIVGLLRQPEFAREVGDAARAVVSERHGWDAVARAYGGLYDTVVSEREAALGRG